VNARTFENWSASIDTLSWAERNATSTIRYRLAALAGKPVYPSAHGIESREYHSAAARHWFLQEFRIAAARYPLYHDATR
jgi:hypothetical protein